MKTAPLSPALLAQLRDLDSGTVANTIETFEVRLRNAGFSDSRIRCMFEDLPPLVGYAATARIRTTDPPMEGHIYYDRIDWLSHVLSVPPPRIAVVQDMDGRPGLGAFIGETHANILQALDCVGTVTNGAVRDLPAVRTLNFQMFAHNVSVSHSYCHVVDFGGPIQLGSLTIRPGDLLHGDRHGIQTIPMEIAGNIPATAQELLKRKRHIIEICRSEGITLEKIKAAVKNS